jgi:uncharacterized protein (DUF362 family)
MKQEITRRELLGGSAATAAACLLSRARIGQAAVSRPAQVSVAWCRTYGYELLPTMEKMFDQIGGLGRLVKGKTVAVKVNFIGNPWRRLDTALTEDTFWTHPRVIGAVVHLLGKAGANRIRVVEGGMSTAESLEEFMLSAGWEPRYILNAAPRVELENTNFLGYGKKYSRLKVPFGGWIFPAYDLNHSYEDCDVFFSVAKLKEHMTTGFTLSMKNIYGITPTTVYGDGAGADEPSLRPHGGRSLFHGAKRKPPKSAPQEIDPSLPRDGGFRIPRITVECCAARPVDLAIIDGIHTVTGGEVPRFKTDASYAPGMPRNMLPVKPGVLIAGTTCVATDAVGMAMMGFDPLADRGTEPFVKVQGLPRETSDNTLRLGEEVGLGFRDLRKNEVVGDPISEVAFDFKAVRERLRSEGATF